MTQTDFRIKEQNQSDEAFSHSDQMENSKVKQQKKSKSRKIIRQNSQKYHWLQKENIKYLEFIVSFRMLFDLNLEEKRYIGINKLMSSYIKTRDSVQCHSHHQKILKKYGTIDQAIAQMTKMYIKKSSLLRKRNQNIVKIQEVSLWLKKQEKSGQEFDNNKAKLQGLLGITKETSEQVKSQQLQQW